MTEETPEQLKARIAEMLKLGGLEFEVVSLGTIPADDVCCREDPGTDFQVARSAILIEVIRSRPDFSSVNELIDFVDALVMFVMCGKPGKVS